MVLPKREMQRSNERCRDPTRALRPEREREREREREFLARERDAKIQNKKFYHAIVCC